MAGSPSTRLVPNPPEGLRAALLIGITTYQDPELSQLRAPAHDAQDLAEVLGDPRIGAFTYNAAHNFVIALLALAAGWWAGVGWLRLKSPTRQMPNEMLLR